MSTPNKTTKNRGNDMTPKIPKEAAKSLGINCKVTTCLLAIANTIKVSDIVKMIEKRIMRMGTLNGYMAYI